MSLELVTGYSAEPHVSSADDGALNACVFGAERAVFDMGQKFAASITSNNEITIADGEAVDQGRHIRMIPGDYETVTISNGSAGLYRADLICIQYSKNAETSVEAASFVVVEGTSGSEYVDPDVTDGDILSGDTLDQFPLYRVKINGFSLESVEPLFTARETMLDAVKSAQSDADSAAAAASAAQNTADSAVSAAAAAQSTANSAVKDSGWLALPFKSGFSNMYPVVPSKYRKIGNMVQVHMCAKGASANWSEVAILPEGYRPDVSIDIVGRYDSHQRCNININDSGGIQFISTDGTLDASKLFSFNATFFVP